MTRRTITFYGNFGTQNFGNEWTLHAIACNLLERVPDARFQCVCTTPEDTRQRHAMPAFPSHAGYPEWLNPETWPLGRFFVKWARRIVFRLPLEFWHWVKAFRIMRRTDMLIVPGTQVVSDYCTGPLSWPYDIFMWSLAAKLCRTKVLFVCVGVGPINHPLSRWFIKTALRMADYRSYREGASKSYLESLGFRPNGDAVYPDLVFSLPVSELRQWNPRNHRGRVVGVAVKDYGGAAGSPEYEDYLNRMSALVAWLRGQGCVVRLLIGDILYDSSVRLDFVERLRKNGISLQDEEVLAHPILTAEDLVAQLADCDLVISPRLHNLIMAMMLNRPVIALSDHQKLDSLMLELGMKEWCVPLPGLDLELLKKKFLELQGNLEALKGRIDQSTAACRHALSGQYASITESLVNH